METLYEADGIEIQGIPSNRPFTRYDLNIWIGNGAYFDTISIYVSRLAIMAHPEDA